MISDTSHASPAAPSAADRKLPPIAELIVLSVALMISGGVYLAAHLPKPPALAAPVALLASGGVLTVVAMLMLSRVRPFAWSTFFLVARWAFLAYLIIAGLLGFTFIYDHTRGGTLAVLLATLAVFAVDVPAIIAFTVARYEEQTPAG